jgi:hypothetical protein
MAAAALRGNKHQSRAGSTKLQEKQRRKPTGNVPAPLFANCRSQTSASSKSNVILAAALRHSALHPRRRNRESLETMFREAWKKARLNSLDEGCWTLRRDLSRRIFFAVYFLLSTLTASGLCWADYTHVGSFMRYGWFRVEMGVGKVRPPRFLIEYFSKPRLLQISPYG